MLITNGRDKKFKDGMLNEQTDESVPGSSKQTIILNIKCKCSIDIQSFKVNFTDNPHEFLREYVANLLLGLGFIKTNFWRKVGNSVDGSKYTLKEVHECQTVFKADR